MCVCMCVHAPLGWFGCWVELGEGCCAGLYPDTSPRVPALKHQAGITLHCPAHIPRRRFRSDTIGRQIPPLAPPTPRALVLCLALLRERHREPQEVSNRSSAVCLEILTGAGGRGSPVSSSFSICIVHCEPVTFHI